MTDARRLAVVLTVLGVVLTGVALAALFVGSAGLSASAVASAWNAVGATITGCECRRPSTVVDGSRWPQSTIARGRRASRCHAATLSRNVISSPAPPA